MEFKHKLKKPAAQLLEMQILRNLGLQMLRFHSSYTYSRHRLKNGASIYKKETRQQQFNRTADIKKEIYYGISW